MKVGKKASVKAIEYCSKLVERQLGLSTSWSECFDIIMEGFIYDLHTTCKSMGDTTTIKLYKEPGEKADLIETFIFPNEEAYDWKDADWQWNFIYKQLTEWLMKNMKKIGKSKKKSKSKGPQMSEEEIQNKLSSLKSYIKTAKGKDKKKAIEEFNALSKKIEKTPEPEPVTKQSITTSRSAKDIGREKLRLKALIRSAIKRGEDTTALEQELAAL